MGLYAEYLAAYDVEDNRERTRVFDFLKDSGMIPIQKSVFWGYLTPGEARAVLRRLRELKASTDRAFLCRVSLADTLRENSVGHAPEIFLWAKKSYALC